MVKLTYLGESILNDFEYSFEKGISKDANFVNRIVNLKLVDCPNQRCIIDTIDFGNGKFVYFEAVAVDEKDTVRITIDTLKWFESDLDKILEGKP